MSGLTQNDKLRALGLKRNESEAREGRTNYQKLSEAKEWEEFRDDVQDDLGDYDEFETYLTDLEDDEGESLFSEEEAERFRLDIENKYNDSFSDFQGDLDEYDSFDEWESAFRFGTTIGGNTIDEEGNDNQGVKFHEEDGVTRAGIPVPAGTVEIFGPRIEFSQTDPTIEDPEAVFEVRNFEASDTVVIPGATVTYSAEITNESGYSTSFTARLMENDDRVDSKNLDFQVDETRTVEFERTYWDYESVDVRINDSDEETVVVTHIGIIP